jgi:hypothetical protein
MNMARKPKTPEQMIESACAALREHLKADSIIPVALSILRREYPEGAIVVPDVTEKGRDYIRWEALGNYETSFAVMQLCAERGTTAEQAAAYDLRGDDND